MYTSRVQISDIEGEEVFVASFLLNEGDVNEAEAQAFVQIGPDGEPIDPATAAAVQAVAAAIAALPFGDPSDDAWAVGPGYVLSLLKAIAEAAVGDAAAEIGFAPTSLGRKAGADSLSVTTSTDDIKWTPVTLTPDTSTLAAGDVIVDTQVVPACVKADDAPGLLQSFVLVDESDQGAALTVWVLRANSSVGTENAAPSITDANAANILGYFDIATTDYKDLGGVKVASIKNIGIVVKPASGTDDLYLAIVNGAGTPTYGASALKASLGIVG